MLACNTTCVPFSDTGSVFEEHIVLADCEIITGVDESHVPAKAGEKVLVMSKDERGR